jgi:hypothetical protein
MEDHNSLVISYAMGWNLLDASYFEEIISENFIYGSQRVLEDLVGKENYLEYIKERFHLIKMKKYNVTAELGRYNGDPCVVLRQDFMKGSIFGASEVHVFTFNEGLISTAHLCMIDPNVRMVERTGFFPC